MTQTSPPGLDLDRLAGYLAATAPELVSPGPSGHPAPLTAEVIAGGRSNLTYIVRCGSSSAFVLRRPPLGHVLPTAHDMAREFRVIAALHPVGFPVPVPLHLCPDASVIGAPFYLMSLVDGVVLRDEADVRALTPQQARRTSELLVATLASLHAIDPTSVGLGDFGRPEGYLARQVARWHQQWEASKTRELPALESLAARLAQTVPAAGRPGIVHGDYRLDNVMVTPAADRILAVFDWEMATLGDTLADLGLLVVYTELAADGLAPTGITMRPSDGFLSSAELISAYADRASVTLDQVGWYVALGYYKLAIISEGIHARYLLGLTVGAGFEQIGPRVPTLVDRAISNLV